VRIVLVIFWYVLITFSLLFSLSLSLTHTHTHIQRRAGYRSLLFANRKHPVRRVPYKTWSKRFIKIDQIVKLFWNWHRKRQCFYQLVRHRALSKKYRRIADAQFLRSCRVYVGWRFHRLNQYRLHRLRKAEALRMGAIVSKRRTVMRLCRYVKYKKWKRMMIRRAIALFSRNALRRYMLMWMMWRDMCRGVSVILIFFFFSVSLLSTLLFIHLSPPQQPTHRCENERESGEQKHFKSRSETGLEIL